MERRAMNRHALSSLLPLVLVGCRLVDNPALAESVDSSTSAAPADPAPSTSLGETMGDDQASSSGTTGTPTSLGETTGDDQASSSGTTGPASECGNGAVDAGEECDGESLGGATCITQGFDDGVLSWSCSSACLLDASGCFACGDGVANGAEECDDGDLNGATCTTLGYSGNGLACLGCLLDASGCGPVVGMVEVPGGMFTMGSNSFWPDAMPERQVDVAAFWIDETEVTVDEYSQCVMDGAACSSPGMTFNCNWGVAGREDHPVNCVTWEQAMAYCVWMGARLPTEAEWEKAARGDDARSYPWGPMPSPTCDYVVAEDDRGVDGCGTGATLPVGSKPMGASPYGAQDMSGNVSEWVADWYASQYDPLDTDNPVGPVIGTEHIGRGGAYTVPPGFGDLRTFHRAESPLVEYGSSAVGFRCARTPPAPPR